MDTTKRDERIIALYTDGLSLRDVGREIGLSPEGVRRILIAHNVETRGMSLSPYRKSVLNTERIKHAIDPETINRQHVERILGDDALRSTILHERASGMESREIGRRHGVPASVIVDILESISSDERRRVIAGVA